MAERTHLQQERYKEHRKNVMHAEKRIKTDPPRLKADLYISNGILNAAQARLRDVEQANRALVTKINYIIRTKGIVDCHEGSFIRESNYKSRVINNLMTERANRELYDLITTIGSKYSKKSQMDSFNDRKNTLLFISRHPEIYKNELLDPLEKWSILPEKNNSEITRCNPQKRTRCFLDFEILNERKLGRMYIEIYNDFVPIAGDNFLRFVRGEKGKGYKNTKLYIIMPGIGFLGGDVDHANGASPRSAYGKPFASENYFLQFNGPGILNLI
ncbi:unnamed protein product [Nezara viridula]|uniref:PPIase cyclophilin-type domain-containing protein n=1 Tax=Nezara viridula TaxID=85310 RepID=A0A9P0E1Y5_NEZVI|nr:unnamed protein product [Nezara viridula]